MVEEGSQNERINIELDESTAQGTYSNLAVVNHSVSEFVVDFIRLMPGIPKAKVKSRIILTPQHAKKLVEALSENILKFEEEHGQIMDHVQTSVSMNFGKPGKA